MIRENASYADPTTIASIRAAETGAVSLDTADESNTLDLLGFPGAAVQLSGTWTGTVTFEVSVDGTNYVAVNMFPSNSTTAAASATANGIWSGSTVGYKYIRTRFSTATSGTVVSTIRATLGGGSGGGAEITGAVTVDNVSITSIAAGDNNIGNMDIASIAAGDNNIGNVDIASALPAGTNAIGKLAANTGVIIGAVEIAAAQTLATVTTVGAVTSITNALPAGTNAIGKLAANSGVDIGDIDVTSIIPGVGATNLGKAEDAPHASGDTGVMILAVRNDAGTALAGTTGDYIPLSTDANGALRVVGSSGTTQYAEDSAHASGDSVVAIGAVRSDTTPTSTAGTAGDYAIPQLDANGRLYTNTVLYTAAGAAIGVDTQGQQDTALGTITSVTGSVNIARASTAVPSAVSADDDGVIPWHTRNGAAVITTVPHTVGGLSTFMASGSDGSSILVATAQAIKASTGQLYGYYIYNPEAAVTFVHFYNVAAASVTVGTTNPLFTVAIPAGAAANMTFPFGVNFSNAGWSCAATTTAGGNTAPATGVSLVAWYA